MQAESYNTADTARLIAGAAGDAGLRGPAADHPTAVDRPSEAPQPSRLDRGTKLDRGWSGVYYPSAGELVLVGRVIEETECAATGTVERSPVRVTNHPAATPNGGSPPETPDDRAARRARSAVRRYAVANGINRLATLTRADQTHDVGLVLADFAAFGRRLRAAYPGVAWVRVLERHRSGALHVHVGLSGFVPKERVASLWPHGFVDVRKVRARSGGGRNSARVTARYLSKYVVKDPVRTGAGHRYEVRQGFQPASVRASAWSVDELLDLFAVSSVPEYRWDSDTEPTWTGPPVVYIAL